MPLELRWFVVVAGFALATVVAALAAPEVEGRRWEALRPSIAGPTAGATCAAPPVGRRWE